MDRGPRGCALAVHAHARKGHRAQSFHSEFSAYRDHIGVLEKKMDMIIVFGFRVQGYMFSSRLRVVGVLGFQARCSYSEYWVVGK